MRKYRCMESVVVPVLPIELITIVASYCKGVDRVWNGSDPRTLSQGPQGGLNINAGMEGQLPSNPEALLQLDAGSGVAKFESQPVT